MLGSQEVDYGLYTDSYHGYEFAAEVGEVGDHPAPDQVGSDRRTSEYVSD
jgi:hypothetical protein